MSKINVLRTFGILFVSAVCFMACSPEEYGPCSIPNTKAHTVACSPVGAAAAEDTFATATCAVDYVFDCDSLICGIYQSSDPFCTHRCLPSASECTSAVGCTKKELDDSGVAYKESCPEGAACVEWIKGTAAYYCLPSSKGSAGSYSGGKSSGKSDSKGSKEE